MIHKQAGRRYYTVKFRYQGKLVQKRTRATSAKVAMDIAATIRSELAKGNWGILEAKPAPTLTELLKKDFLPFIEAKFRNAKPKTADYYGYGVKLLLKSDIANVKIDKITDQQAGQFAAQNAFRKATTINNGLRTLKRALYLAVDWGKLQRKPKITLAKGERQRERVLSLDEAQDYLAMCSQPWRDVASVMLGTGMRPGEVFGLRWENILLTSNGSLIQISEGKTRAARRTLPMIPEVQRALKARHEEQGGPENGWVFPAGSRSGHLEQSSAKIQHSRALARLRKAHEIDESIPLVEPFEPYCMRHTALTWLAESGCDAFVLARIAGHSSITITQRYCHPQAEAIQSAFRKLASGSGVSTDGGYHGKTGHSKGESESNPRLFKSDD